MDPRFGEDLAKRIKAQELSLRAFARLTKTEPSLLSKVVRGQRNPPPTHFERWADGLKLSGRARTEFIDSCWLAGASDYVRSLVDDLRAGKKR